MLGEVEGFSLALNYMTEDWRRQERERGRQKGWNNSTHYCSYLSSLNRCRPGCSLYCSTKTFWQKHAYTQTHQQSTCTHTEASTQIILGKSMHSGFSNFPRCFALHPLGEQGDKASHGGENLLLSYFLAIVCFLFFLLLSFIAFTTCFSLFSMCINTTRNTL